ncbi:helicase superfamily 3 [Laspinema sp. D1]|uniref:Helicase superfamily 3 n=1 Tax=Laspinema palackyanum D2a TaxID=2953684 RepID=A0ABT2N2M6_9CYAN|nr:helicase superfamily 3 [Laspinema sp. D2a]
MLYKQNSISRAISPVLGENSSFDIRRFLGTLTPAKGKNRYYCPVCKSNNLTVNLKNGAYSCWSGCESRDIRQAVAPWQTKILAPVVHRHDAPMPVRMPEGEPVVVRVNPGEAPQPQKASFLPKGVPAHATEIVYRYSSTQAVYRFEWEESSKPKPRKTFRQCHLNEDGLPVWSKGEKSWKAYREEEAFQAIASVNSGFPVLLLVEGEGCVEIARSLGLAAVTLQGSAWTEVELESFLRRVQEVNENAAIAILPDNDAAGLSKAAKVVTAASRQKVPCIHLDPLAICPDLPNKGDIREMVALMGAELVPKLEAELKEAASRPVAEPVDAGQSVEITQKALESLYGDKPGICVEDKLYCWVGTHYELSTDTKELSRIRQFCNNYPVIQKNGSIRFPYAYPRKVAEILEWVKLSVGIDSSETNPPGLNCTNGVLELLWNGSQPSWKLVQHDPNTHLYLYAPQVEYKPDADPTDCDRLLEALAPAQRVVFLKTIAASLDLETVRSHRGREVKALLLKGNGSNGKDSLREVVSLLYGGQGLTSVGFGDFAQADNGRKFPVAAIERSRVNWPSENADKVKLDRLQSLKIAITGDNSFAIERKGQDEYQIAPKCVHLFNVNDSPRLTAALDAIQTRYAVIAFNKTFKTNPDITKNELAADPRFKYHPEFVRESVAPAFLNRVLESLVALMQEGIDYQACAEALEAIQCESSHLWQFAKDVGLVFCKGSKLYAGEIWEALKQWYLENGTLESEVTDKGKEKFLWYDLPSHFDKLCKAVNQVPARIMSIFTNAKKGRDEGGTYLMDLAFADANCVSPDAMPDAGTPTQSQTDATDAILPTVEQKDNPSTCIVDVMATEKSIEEIDLIASVPCQQSDTASATVSATASATPVTASAEPIASPTEQDIKECAEWLALADNPDTFLEIRNLFSEIYQDYFEQFFQSAWSLLSESERVRLRGFMA